MLRAVESIQKLRNPVQTAVKFLLDLMLKSYCSHTGCFAVVTYFKYIYVKYRNLGAFIVSIGDWVHKMCQHFYFGHSKTKLASLQL